MTFTHAVAPWAWKLMDAQKENKRLSLNDVSHSDCCHFNVLLSPVKERKN